MKTEDWKNVEQIVTDALEIDVSRRQKFIAERCADSPEIKREVESLLESESEAENLFESPAVVSYADFLNRDEEPNAVAGQEIGKYRVIREIGYGGMGAVYLAERADGKFAQKVALKLLKREMNTSALRRRFEQEQAILASLEHPHIAHLLDAGTTEDKIPFLAMEYVEGLPIDDYCNQNDLDLNQRLDLFRKVCQAVGFAHRNLIVHRDLKPSNILVDEEGTPKLLDFGISKIISAEFEQINSATVTRLGAMTPAYASPEQLQSKSVTTATDIYSLGIIFYELLSGHRPFETKEEDFKEIYRAVVETEPPPPSSRIWDSGFGTWDSESKISPSSTKPENQNKETDPQSAIPNPKSLSGDLDNIVLKAIRKEPERRYSSAENFAEDIHRHQRGLPVTARPNTFSYRAEKFVRRNRVAVIAGLLILLAVIGGVIATLWQSHRARLEAQKAQKISGYMKNVLNFSNPHWTSSNPKRNRDAKISDALDEALKNIDSDLAGEPEIQAEILLTIGGTYTSQGQYDKANPILQQAVEKFNQIFGEDNPKSQEANGLIGINLLQAGKYQQAEEFYNKAINYYRSHPPTDELQIKNFVVDLNDMATIQQNYESNLVETEKLYREGLELSKNLSAKNRGMMPIMLGNLAWLLHSRGDFQEALKYYDQAHQELVASGSEDKMEAGTLYNKMGVAYTEMGDYKQAETYYQKAYDILMKQVGAENFYTVTTMYRHAYNLYKQDRLDESETLVNQSLEIQHKLFPDGHPVTAYSERLLGEIYTKRGDLKKGEDFLRKALDYLLKKSKEPNRDISLAKLSLGENLIAQKRFDEARELVASALDGSLKVVGEEHPFTKQCRAVLDSIPK